jgi:tetratricopeptide (TPR) repeat protein
MLTRDLMGVVLMVPASLTTGCRPGGESPAPPSPPATDAADALGLPSEEERALRTEQLDVATQLLREIPKSDDAVYLMGLVQKEQGNSVEAVRLWEEALRLDPARADALDSLGREAMLKEEDEKAVDLFRKALSLDPALSSSARDLGEVLLRLGRGREAVEVLEKAPADDAKMQRLAAEARAETGDHAGARKHYEAALAVAPDFAEAHYGLSRTLSRLGDEAGAKAHLDRFNELKAKDQKVGRHWRKTFDPLEVTQQSVAHTHTDVGRVYAALGNVRRAEELWLRAASLDPKYTVCRSELAALRDRQGRPDDALRLLEEIVAIEPSDPLHRLAIGNLCMRLDRVDGAEQAFRKVMELAPAAPAGSAAMARLYLKARRSPADARRFAETAVSLEPSARNLAILAEACDKSGDRVAAVQAIQKAVELEPGNAGYRRILEALSKVP